MRIQLIVNPFASSVTPRARVVLEQALSADHDVSIVETKRRGHATRLAQFAASDGFDIVAVLGGDGTQNEVANGLVHTDTALATLPGGSTNVFARTLGLADDPVEATQQILQAIEANSIASVGLGSVNRRYFLFHAGIGFDAALIEQVERRGNLKRYLNHALFAYAGLTTWLWHYDRKQPRFTIRFPDGTEVTDGYFTICMNTNPYTYLGSKPFDIATEATLDRGLVAITMRSLSASKLVPALIGALRSPDSLQSKSHIDYQHDLSSFEVIGHAPFPYQVDGDFLGTVSALRISHEPDVLRLVQPLT